jgi:septal ring factor EnvC (AmiA/AmiB activator)
MTGEEMERGIEFLLVNQAKLESQMEQTSRQIEETNKRLESYAEIHSEFIQIVTRQIAAQGEINTSIGGVVRDLATAQTRTDERLDRLAALVEQHINMGHGE